MPSRFVAPKRLDTLEDVRKALQLVQEQFDSNGISRARQQLVTKDTTLAAGEFVRLSPRQGGTIVAKLPKASADNIGLRIELSIERPNGTVKISAQSPDTVSGLKTASFTLAGLIILESNGTDQWVLFNQLPTNSPAAATNYFFSNSNNVSFGTVGSTVTASVTVASTQGSIRVLAGTATVLSSQFSFANANNINWSQATNGIISASWLGLSVSAGTTSGQVTSLRFQNSNNVSWGLNGSVITGSVASSLDRVAAGTLGFLGGAFGLSFQDSNGVSWNASTNAGSVGTVFIQASVNTSPRLGLVSHVGGNSVSNVTQLAFSNASNVTWSLSTAVGAATVLASVAAGGGGGIALADVYGSTATSGTLVFTGNPNSTITNLWSLNSVSNNIAFRISGQSIVGAAWFGVQDATGGNAIVGSRVNFVQSNGITFGLATGSDSVNARQINITASHNGLTAGPLAIGAVIEAGASPVNAGTINITNFNFTADQRGYRKVLANLSNTSSLFLEWEAPQISGGGLWNKVSGVASVGFFAYHRRPYFFQPFPEGPLAGWGPGNGVHRPGDWYMAASGQSSANSSNSSLFATAMLGLYVVTNGSQLTLINSCSASFSNGGNATSFQSNLHGSRWIRFNATNWSNSSSALTYGEYWCGLMVVQGQSNNITVTNGTADVRLSIVGASGRNPQGNLGVMGVNHVTSVSENEGAFWGRYTNSSMSSLPGSLASNHLSQQDAANAFFLPGISIRANGLNANFPAP